MKRKADTESNRERITVSEIEKERETDNDEFDHETKNKPWLLWLLSRKKLS